MIRAQQQEKILIEVLIIWCSSSPLRIMHAIKNRPWETYNEQRYPHNILHSSEMHYTLRRTSVHLKPYIFTLRTLKYTNCGIYIYKNIITYMRTLHPVLFNKLLYIHNSSSMKFNVLVHTSSANTISYWFSVSPVHIKQFILFVFTLL